MDDGRRDGLDDVISVSASRSEMDEELAAAIREATASAEAAHRDHQLGIINENMREAWLSYDSHIRMPEYDNSRTRDMQNAFRAQYRVGPLHAPDGMSEEEYQEIVDSLIRVAATSPFPEVQNPQEQENPIPPGVSEEVYRDLVSSLGRATADAVISRRNADYRSQESRDRTDAFRYAFTVDDSHIPFTFTGLDSHHIQEVDHGVYPWRPGPTPVFEGPDDNLWNMEGPVENELQPGHVWPLPGVQITDPEHISEPAHYRVEYVGMSVHVPPAENTPRPNYAAVWDNVHWSASWHPELAAAIQEISERPLGPVTCVGASLLNELERVGHKLCAVSLLGNHTLQSIDRLSNTLNRVWGTISAIGDNRVPVGGSSSFIAGQVCTLLGATADTATRLGWRVIYDGGQCRRGNFSSIQKQIVAVELHEHDSLFNLLAEGMKICIKLLNYCACKED